MIWGLTLEPGCVYTRTAPVPIHLSLATLDCRGKVFPGTDPVKVSHVVLKTPSCEQLVCSLVQGLVLQQQLNLQLTPNEEVAFSNQGNCCVYITGYSPLAGDDYQLEDEMIPYPSEENSPDNHARAYEKNTGWVPEDVSSENGIEAENETFCSSARVTEQPVQNKKTDERESHPDDVICIAIKDEPVDGYQSEPSRGSTPQSGPVGPDGAQGPSQIPATDVICEMTVPELSGDCQHQSQTKSPVRETVETISLEPNDSSLDVPNSTGSFDTLEKTCATIISTATNKHSKVVKSETPCCSIKDGKSGYSGGKLAQTAIPSRTSVKRRGKELTGSNVQYSQPDRWLLPMQGSAGDEEMQTRHANSHVRKTTGHPRQGVRRSPDMLDNGQYPRFQCTYCRKSLNCRRSLQNHEMIHTGIRPWQCRFCQKSFIQKSQWKVHERIHTGIKPFACSHCGKAFSRRYNVRMHSRVCRGYNEGSPHEGSPPEDSRGKLD